MSAIKLKNQRNEWQPESSENRRFTSFRLFTTAGIILLLFGFLVIRLVRLQLVQSEMYLEQSETNRIRVVEIPPLRGLIYDRSGDLLVDNFPSYCLYATPYELNNNLSARDSLLRFIDLEDEEFDRRLNRRRGNRYTAVRIQRDISFETYAALEERKLQIPGINFIIEPKRAYRFQIAPHSIGYIGELKDDDPDRYPNSRAGDIVGLSGIERTWNDELSGENGIEYLEVDAFGRVVGPLPGVDPTPPIPGSDLYLTIDLDLQQYAEELLAGKEGAVVCIEPATGEVLALASIPDYPPETFANVLTQDQWNSLQQDPRTPLLHRAVQGVYPPASIFKMAVLYAGFASDAIPERWEVTCQGGMFVGDRWFNCWNHGGHGEVQHNRAIETSCDVFFYQLNLRLGIDRFHEYISMFNFGQRTGIDLPTEARGLLPDREYFNRRYGRYWTEGLLLNIAIGQGEVLITPLQAALYTTILANGGWWYTPHLVKEIHHADGTIELPEYAERHEPGFDEEIMQTIREDMLRVTEGWFGTAAWLRDPRVQIAAKTGTAQAPTGADHAWFVAFAPYDDPQIAVAVLVEHGVHGSTGAAPIAFKLIRKHLGLDEEWWRRYRAQVLAEIHARETAGDTLQTEPIE